MPRADRAHRPERAQARDRQGCTGVERLADDVAALRAPASCGHAREVQAGRVPAGRPGPTATLLLSRRTRRSKSDASSPRPASVPWRPTSPNRFAGLVPARRCGSSSPHGDFFLREGSNRRRSSSRAGPASPDQVDPRGRLPARRRARDGALLGRATGKDLHLPTSLRSGRRSGPAFRFVPVCSVRPADGWTGRTVFVHQAVMADFPSLAVARSTPAARRQ